MGLTFINVGAMKPKTNIENNTLEHAVSTTAEYTYFGSKFIDKMLLDANRQLVANYLDSHHDWFTKCAQPMEVELIDTNAYAITIGKYGSFGYEIEPKIGLELLPQDQGIYRIQTVNIPNYQTTAYIVDFHAAMYLDEVLNGDYLQTEVNWELDLQVAMQFPKFITKLPQSLIQSTGDRVLEQVVKQVSKRLTKKVQNDFIERLKGSK